MGVSDGKRSARCVLWMVKNDFSLQGANVRLELVFVVSKTPQNALFRSFFNMNLFI
jgi:hypothetical protein